MASDSLKLVFLFILLSFFNFQTPEAEEVTYFKHKCSENTTTANSTFQVKVMTILTSLSSNATVRNFYNDTVSDRNASNAVYGLFMCRGDVPSNLCGQCVKNASQTLSSECYLSTWAIIWYHECMVRYSNSSFFSTMETWPGFLLSTTAAYASNQATFVPLVRHTLNETADEAAFSPVGDRYATKEAKVSENQTLFCLIQCTLDISPKDCRECVTSLIGYMIPEGRLGWKSFSPSCTVRYEMYPFYPINAPGQGRVLPATKHLETDSIYSQDPLYLSHNCSSYGYQDYRQETDTLLFYLSSNATSSSNNRFYKADVGAKVFGLFMCRGDVPPGLCGQCVVNATHRIASKCPSSMFAKAIIWYDHCFLRYSNQPFFYRMSTSPRFDNLNVTKVNDLESSFRFSVLSNALAKVVEETASSDEKYWTQSFILNDNQTLYVLAQCTQDLPALECYSCLSDVIGSAIPWSRLGSVGGRVLYPSCTMRFELFQFYRIGTENHHPPPPPLIRSPAVLPPPTEKKDRPQAVILIVVSIIGSMILLSSCYYLLRRKAKKSYKHILKENFGHESTTVESLQFDFAIIQAATNNFSPHNRIGKGGFGQVYKGVLHDGRHIAVKRLSRSSTQGAVEFKNEVLLIAKLQHRNLVAFIGFCLEEQEKILIYEYVPNKSLDYFLFGAHSEKLLSWSERHKIIGGIAREILYLHEYSRLKVIHRDLKPSNVLLDENMNPKIFDFGLAKIVEIDQQQGSTNKIAGTWGYMSPEYAMLGQFSEKSDVFSFGVMILEIITGKKNIGSYESHHVADGLLSLVWRQYKDQMPLSILDPKLKENCSTFEVIRCIQIGLLCVQEDPDDRPMMMTVVSYLSNHSMELPYPQEPAFFLRRKMDPKIVVQESCSSSANEMSTSNFFPR